MDKLKVRSVLASPFCSQLQTAEAGSKRPAVMAALAVTTCSSSGGAGEGDAGPAPAIVAALQNGATPQNGAVSGHHPGRPAGSFGSSEGGSAKAAAAAAAAAVTTAGGSAAAGQARRRRGRRQSSQAAARPTRALAIKLEVLATPICHPLATHQPWHFTLPCHALQQCVAFIFVQSTVQCFQANPEVALQELVAAPAYCNKLVPQADNHHES